MPQRAWTHRPPPWSGVCGRRGRHPGGFGLDTCLDTFSRGASQNGPSGYFWCVQIVSKQNRVIRCWMRNRLKQGVFSGVGCHRQILAHERRVDCLAFGDRLALNVVAALRGLVFHHVQCCSVGDEGDHARFCRGRACCRAFWRESHACFHGAAAEPAPMRGSSTQAGSSCGNAKYRLAGPGCAPFSSGSAGVPSAGGPVRAASGGAIADTGKVTLPGLRAPWVLAAMFSMTTTRMTTTDGEHDRCESPCTAFMHACAGGGQRPWPCCFRHSPACRFTPGHRRPGRSGWRRGRRR